MLAAQRGEALHLRAAQIERVIAALKRRDAIGGSNTRQALSCLFIQIECIGGQGLIGRRIPAFAFARRYTCLIIIFDDFQPVVQLRMGLMVEQENCIFRIISDRFHVLIEQGQPMLHTRIRPSVRYGLIKRIFLADRAECVAIADAEAFDSLCRKNHFVHGLE